MRQSTLPILACSLLLGAWPVLSQENSTATTTSQDSKKALQWNAQMDGYVLGSFNDPPSRDNALQAFDTHANAARLNMANFDLDYNANHFGAHLDAGYGDAFRIMGASDRIRGLNPYLPQFFVSYKPIGGSDLRFDFGKFYTSVGAEVADASANFNYSRSLLFTLGEPFYHFGLRMNVPVTKSFSVGFQVLNGWNNLGDNNHGKTLGFTSAWTKSKWSWSQAVLVGAEKDGTTQGKRQLLNEVLTVAPRPSLQAYVEALYGRDKRIGPGADAWYGAAAAARWTVTKRVSLSPRLEYYVDRTGFTSGVAQHLREVTATAEYKVYRFASLRLEYRDDLSNQPFFDRGANRLGKQQNTVLLALLLSTKGNQ